MEHHGFGLRIKPKQLANVNAALVRDTVQRLLNDSSFKVRTGCIV